MLGAALSGIVFATIVWMVYAIKFINASLSGISFFEAGILNVLLYVLFFLVYGAQIPSIAYLFRY